MCDSDANTPYDEFLKYEKIFWANVHDLLSVSSTDRYNIVYRSKKLSKTIDRIYLSKKDKKVVKIIINLSFDSEGPILQVHAENKQFEEKILNFESAKNMVSSMEQVRNNMRQAKLLIKLQYNL